ncbi:MAG: peptidylprolyl isomerase [Gemmatimonadetes bacterium]|nr:peptidylprolyl isomerase [Gemmatimonadota bacterium]
MSAGPARRALFRLLGLLPVALAAAGCTRSNPQVELRTRFGVVRIELDSARAPRTVANFLRYVDEGRYAGAAFYRVHHGEAQLMQPTVGVVQGGLWRGDSTRLLPPVPFESTRQTGLRHVDGTVSMAHFADPSSARAEFFIVLGEQPHLDFHDSTPAGMGYAAFGRVVEGMEIVRAIEQAPVRGELLRVPIPFRAARVK